MLVKKSVSYSKDTLNKAELDNSQSLWRTKMGESITLCGKAIAATIPSNEFQHGYQGETVVYGGTGRRVKS